MFVKIGVNLIIGCVEFGGSEERVFSFRRRGRVRSYTCTLGFRGVVGLLTITRYAREGYAYTKGFKLSIRYSRFRN